MFNVLTGGFVPPAVPVKLKLPGLTANTGDAGAVTVKVTGKSLGDPLAPGAVIVIVPVYIPAANPAVSTFTVRELGAAPLSGLTLSHDWSPFAVQFNVPPPVFAILRVWAAGFVPPATSLKLKLSGLTFKTGGNGADTLAISTQATSAVGTVAAVFPPTTTPKRGLLSAFTTLPANCIHVTPPFPDTYAVTVFVVGLRSNRNNTLVVVLLSALLTVAALPAPSCHHSTT
jgi:hypothetical protein